MSFDLRAVFLTWWVWTMLKLGDIVAPGTPLQMLSGRHLTVRCWMRFSPPSSNLDPTSSDLEKHVIQANFLLLLVSVTRLTLGNFFNCGRSLCNCQGRWPSRDLHQVVGASHHLVAFVQKERAKKMVNNGRRQRKP